MLDNAATLIKSTWNFAVSVVEFTIDVTSDIIKRLKFEDD